MSIETERKKQENEKEATGGKFQSFPNGKKERSEHN
jgi:hypothetical protein